jgi:hypothetical protein
MVSGRMWPVGRQLAHAGIGIVTVIISAVHSFIGCDWYGADKRNSDTNRVKRAVCYLSMGGNMKLQMTAFSLDCELFEHTSVQYRIANVLPQYVICRNICSPNARSSGKNLWLL